MEYTKICQSCAMPLVKNEDFGTNEDGSKNRDYCIYCYKDGNFTSEITMEEMIDFCAKYLATENLAIGYENAKAEMQQILPQLKRWK